MADGHEFSRPNYLEVSSHFLHDAIDFELRYRFCLQSDGPLFYAPRSRRMKVFIDLRMGIESALKSLVSYHCNNDRRGKTLVNWIESFKHSTDKLIRKAGPYLPEDFFGNYGESLADLTKLPVGLRYRFDAWEFYDNQEELYERTIGDNSWLSLVHRALTCIIELINNSLKSHSRIVNAEDVLLEMQEPRYAKYKK